MEESIDVRGATPENSEINWEHIRKGFGDDDDSKLTRAEEEIERVEYISLSDVLVNRSRGAVWVLQALDIQNDCKPHIRTFGRMYEGEKGACFRLKPYRPFALKDVPEKEARTYKPGEKIEWTMQIFNRKPRGRHKGEGKKLGADAIQDMKRRGGKEAEKLIEKQSAVVDEYGLITVSYAAAAQLLQNHGIHYETRMAISQKEEYTKKAIPHETKEGEKVIQTRWNWLFEECPPWKDPANKDKSKRGPGRPPKNED